MDAKHHLCIFICVLIIILKCCAQLEVDLDIGETCTLENNLNGTCKHFSDCPHAKTLIEQKKQPTHCTFKFDGLETIVCCPENSATNNNTENVGNILEMCQAYNKVRKSNANQHNEDDVYAIVGGYNSHPIEFPHMALLGFGNNTINITWACGGSLISNRFVLTAGHCIYHRNLGLSKWVRLGDLDIASSVDIAKPKDYLIKRHIPHHNYSSSYHYHDIALLELAEQVTMNEYVNPACIHSTKVLPDPDEYGLVVTGWGNDQFAGEQITHLQKVSLKMFNETECKSKYKAGRKLPNGIDEEIQICAGGREEIADTCQGDSGGPLQYVSYILDIRPIYFIVGVTSFGKSCGIQHNPGVYTRLYPYISWIESVIVYRNQT